MAKNSRAKIAANNRYTAQAYDRIQLVVPKGQKDVIKAYADEVGESVNMYMQKATLARMGLEAWPEKKED